jgi:hypothetical protein
MFAGDKAIIELRGSIPRHIQLGDWEMGRDLQDPESTKIFCMYAFRPTVAEYPVDERNFAFGSMALVMTDPQEFIGRVSKVVKALQIPATARLVEYVDVPGSARMGPFRKRWEFAYQSEWRLACRNPVAGPMNIAVGDIRDISVLMRSEEVNTQVTMGS